MSHAHLPSEQVVIAAPMSFAGSAARLWRLAGRPAGDGWRLAVRALVVIPAVALLILTVWMMVFCWYLMFGLMLVPYRVLRRGGRKRRREELRHREMMDALQQRQP